MDQVTNMTLAIIPVCMSIALLSACSNGGRSETTGTTEPAEAKISMTAPEVTFKPDGNGVTTAKPSGPVQISYRIIGQPIVGQPVAIDLRFSSALGVRPFNVSYRINDATALLMPESQPLSVTISPTSGEESAAFAAQVTVIPMREGRLYLNVAAQIETDGGSLSSVTAVPIQVGAAPRELQDNGVVTTDENGELIRTLPAKED